MTHEENLKELRRRYGFAYFHWWWSWVRLAIALHKHGAPIGLVVALSRIGQLDPFA
jgi:hypothetical protein